MQYLTSVINKDLKPVFVVRWRENAAERLYNAKTVYKAKEVEVDNFFFLSDKKIKLKPETSVHEK